MIGAETKLIDIIALSTHQLVIPGTAIQPIIPQPALHEVVAGTPRNAIGEIRAENRIMLVRAGEIEPACEQLRIDQNRSIGKYELGNRMGPRYVVTIKCTEDELVGAGSRLDHQLTCR